MIKLFFQLRQKICHQHFDRMRSTGRFSTAFFSPANNFSRSNSSRRPSRLTTCKSARNTQIQSGKSVLTIQTFATATNGRLVFANTRLKHLGFNRIHLGSA